MKEFRNGSAVFVRRRPALCRRCCQAGFTLASVTYPRCDLATLQFDRLRGSALLRRSPAGTLPSPSRSSIVDGSAVFVRRRPALYRRRCQAVFTLACVTYPRCDLATLQFDRLRGSALLRRSPAGTLPSPSRSSMVDGSAVFVRCRPTPYRRRGVFIRVLHRK